MFSRCVRLRLVGMFGAVAFLASGLYGSASRTLQRDVSEYFAPGRHSAWFYGEDKNFPQAWLLTAGAVGLTHGFVSQALFEAGGHDHGLVLALCTSAVALVGQAKANEWLFSETYGYYKQWPQAYLAIHALCQLLSQSVARKRSPVAHSVSPTWLLPACLIIPFWDVNQFVPGMDGAKSWLGSILRLASE